MWPAGGHGGFKRLTSWVFWHWAESDKISKEKFNKIRVLVITMNYAALGAGVAWFVRSLQDWMSRDFGPACIGCTWRCMRAVKCTKIISWVQYDARN